MRPRRRQELTFKGSGLLISMDQGAAPITQAWPTLILESSNYGKSQLRNFFLEVRREPRLIDFLGPEPCGVIDERRERLRMNAQAVMPLDRLS